MKKCDIPDTIYFFQQPAGSSRSIIGDSNKTTSTKTTTKRKISKPLLTRKTPSHSKINNKNIVPKDSPPVADENPCQSEKSLQSEEKSCQSLSLPASTNVTSTSTTSSVSSTSSLDKKRVRFFDQAARSEDTLASRTGSTPPNVIKIETQLPGAALVSPPKEEGGGKTTIDKRIIDEVSYENVSSSDSSASSSSEDEEEHDTPLNTQNSEKRSLGKSFTAQTVSISKTAHNNTDDKKLMPPPPYKLPTQLKKNGGHEKKDGGQSIDFKKTE